MSTPIGEANIQVDADTDPAMRALREFSRDAQGRLRDVRSRFVTEGNAISESLTRSTDRTDRFGFSLRGIGNILSTVGPALGKTSLALGAVGAAAGTALPLLAGVVTTLENIAPAGAVAATGMLAVGQASAAIKLGMVGIEDAVTAAFDTSKKGAKEFEESLKALAPNAREFAREVKALQPELQKFQQGVQNRIFQDFGVALDVLSKTVLPTVRTNLNQTADTLNRMALGAAGAAVQLAEKGTLGQALSGANTGLTNLTQIPAQVTTALGQLAAAGAPAFDRLTTAAADAATGISDRLSGAFESGALEQSVNDAIGFLKDLGGIIGNVFGTLRNVLGAASSEGTGTFAVLTQITQTLEDVSATQGFQDAIRALVDTMAVLGDTVGPLLGSALGALGPVLVALAGPAQLLVTSLGEALAPIIEALGPVLVSAAGAVGLLVTALAPLLPVVGNLIASLLPPLVPILDTIALTFAAAAPLIRQVGDILTAVLAPIIASLPAIITPLLDTFTELTATLLPVLSDLLTQLAPTFAQLAGTVAELIVAAAPLLQVLGPLLVDTISALLPVITPVLGLLTSLVSVLVDNFAGAVTNVIVPAIDVIVALFSGDLSGAVTALGALFTGVWEQIKNVVSNVGGFISGAIDTIIGIFQYLYDVLVGGSIVPDLVNAIMGLFTSLGAFFTSIIGSIRDTVVSGFNAVKTTATNIFNAVRNVISGAITAARVYVSVGIAAIRQFFSDGFGRIKTIVSNAINNVVKTIQGLKSRAQSAVSGAATWLVNAGKDAIRGLIRGMSSLLGQVRAKAAEIADTVTGAVSDALGISSPSKVMERLAKFIGDGLVKGLTASQAKIKTAGKKLADLLRDAVEGKGISKRESSLLRRVASDSKQLRQLASDRDKIGEKLKAANAKLEAIESKYAQVRSSIADKILASGEIVQQGVRQPTATGILASLQASVKAAQDFQKALATLKAKGLRGDLLEQIASAGVEAGAATAAALVAATPQQLAAINSAQGGLVKASKKTGTTVADALYGAGVKAAQGLVDGLKSQEAAIQKQMDKIAKAMVDAIKKALKIKSPSQVAQALGGDFGTGLVRGLDQSLTPVRAATSRLSDAVGSMRTTGRNAPFTLSPAAATAMVAANRSLTSVTAPNVTVMIGNRVINDHIRIVVDQENATVARQQIQGVRR